jgi:hypothetical protein
MSLPRPVDEPRGHAPGTNVDRVLLVGSGRVVGWGVTTQAVGLPGALARALSARTGRGCTVEAVADPAMTVAGVSRALDAAVLDRYDALVVMVGVNDALHLTPVTKWNAHLGLLADSLGPCMRKGTAVFLAGIQPIRSIPIFDSWVGSVADAHARRLNDATRALVSATPGCHFVPLGDETRDGADAADRFRSRHDYDRWAEAMVRWLVPHLDPTRKACTQVPHPTSEERRQRSVDLIPRALRHRHADLQRITALANRAFRTRTALLTVLDGDTQWSLAASGHRFDDIPRALSICNAAIEHEGAFIVPDILEDPRFRDWPLVTDGQQIRFYAGFPVEAPSGERIGALCVIDTRPRRQRDDLDEVFLRELALRAQTELWRLIPDHDDDPAPHRAFRRTREAMLRLRGSDA